MKTRQVKLIHVRLFCNPKDAGSAVHGILQARIVEWVAILFSRGASGPGIDTGSPALQVDPLLSEPPGMPMSYTKVSSLLNDKLLKGRNWFHLGVSLYVSCCRVHVEICHVTELNSTMCDLKLLC